MAVPGGGKGRELLKVAEDFSELMKDSSPQIQDFL